MDPKPDHEGGATRWVDDINGYIRRCRMCGQWKALNRFVANKTRVLGYDYACRACWADAMRHRRHRQDAKPLPQPEPAGQDQDGIARPG